MYFILIKIFKKQLLRNKSAEKSDWNKTLKDENGGFTVTSENL